MVSSCSLVMHLRTHCVITLTRLSTLRSGTSATSLHHSACPLYLSRQRASVADLSLLVGLSSVGHFSASPPSDTGSALSEQDAPSCATGGLSVATSGGWPEVRRAAWSERNSLLLGMEPTLRLAGDSEDYWRSRYSGRLSHTSCQKKSFFCVHSC